MSLLLRNIRPVYPRVCGGTSKARYASLAMAGLSPRVRGNPAFSRVSHYSLGSIPACAGEPSPRR